MSLELTKALNAAIEMLEHLQYNYVSDTKTAERVRHFIDEARGVLKAPKGGIDAEQMKARLARDPKLPFVDQIAGKCLSDD